MKIKYEEHGAGIPVVLLHAFPLSRKMWAGQIEPLAQNGFRVVLPDFFGFGQTEIDENANSLEDFAREINNLLEHLKIERAIIGGLSMGGYVTFDFYRLFPEKCRALVLADTTSSADTAEKRAGRMKTIEKIEQSGVGVLIEEMLPNLISDATKQQNPALVEKLTREFADVSQKGAINALKAMAERKSHDSLLKNISIPAALIFGEDDKVTNLENAQKMANEIPHAELFVMERAGHYSNLEQETEFNRVLIEFLLSIKSDERK